MKIDELKPSKINRLLQETLWASLSRQSRQTLGYYTKRRVPSQSRLTIAFPVETLSRAFPSLIPNEQRALLGLLSVQSSDDKSLMSVEIRNVHIPASSALLIPLSDRRCCNILECPFYFSEMSSSERPLV